MTSLSTRQTVDSLARTPPDASVRQRAEGFTEQCPLVAHRQINGQQTTFRLVALR